MKSTLSVPRWSLLFAVAAALAASSAVWLKWDAWIVVPKKRTAVLNALRDPGSAQFSDERISSGGYVCGRVNAKNGMGGYSGFQRYASSENGYLLEDSATTSGREASTTEVMQRLDWRTQFMKTKGRVPSEREEHQAAFEERWTKVCG